jgi:hypothetical protein
LELCASDVSYNDSWNGLAILGCISGSKLRAALEKIHQIIAEGLHQASASAQPDAAEPRYQCEGAQYHDGICADGEHIALSAGSKRAAARFVAADTAAGTRTVTDDWRPKRLGSGLGAAVRSTLGQPVIKARAPSPMLASSSSPHSRRPAAARPLSAATADKQPFDDWFLRSLFALMGIAAAGVLLAVLFERDGAGEAVTALRSRIGSRGLSATRIALRARARPQDDIHYRE